MTEKEEKEAKLLQEKEEKERKALGELADVWLANPNAKSLLQVGTQIFLDDKIGMDDAQACAYRMNEDIVKVERPK